MGWDRGLDYEKINQELERKLKIECRGTARSNLGVLYVQLTNGSRVSEAVDAFNQFLQSGNRDVLVRVRKHKKGTDNRRMVIPELIRREGVPRTPRQVEAAAQRLGINTHSLRYAFVSYLGKQGTAPQIIAKITHHKKLDMIVGYTQQKLADEILDKIARRKSK